jgi:hypothetical protein
MVFAGVKTTGGAAWKLWNALKLHKETGLVLRAALARAICPAQRDEEEVREVAKAIEECMRRTPVPGRKPSGFLQSARAVGRALLPRRFRLRQLPPKQPIGTSFAEHLTTWVRDAATSANGATLGRVHCPEHDTRVEALARRLPVELERELFSGKANEIRQRMAGDLLAHQVGRGERPLTPRERVALAMTTLLASGGAGAVISTAADAPDATTAGVTGGALFLGALAGAVRGKQAFRLTSAQSTARSTVRRWIAHLLRAVTGRGWEDAPDSLREGALYALWQAHRQTECPWSAELDSSRVRERFLPLAAEARDGELEDALTNLDYALVEAESDPRKRSQVLVRLFEVIDASETPDDGESRPRDRVRQGR